MLSLYSHSHFCMNYFILIHIAKIMNLKTNPSMTIHKIVLKDRNVMVAKGVMRAMIKIYTYN